MKAVVDKCDEMDIIADPTTVICDFEKAAINSVTATLGQQMRVQGCFYHLTQNTWRKIQELGLSVSYRNNAEFKHFCGMLDGLAFLPVSEIAAGLQFLRGCMPTGDGLEDVVHLVDYFDTTYVNGSARQINRPNDSQCILPLRIRRVPPLFPPALWNVIGQCQDQ